MDVKDVMNMKWKEVNWSDLYMKALGNPSKPYVYEKDIDIFVLQLFKKVARQLKVDFNELKLILEDENEAFFKLKEELYKHYDALDMLGANWLNLAKKLEIPDIRNTEDKVNKCIQMFNQLSNLEKIEFLTKTGNINIEIT